LISMAINFDTWRGFGAISNTHPIWRKNLLWLFIQRPGVVLFT
jgi:hypothetical protein